MQQRGAAIIKARGLSSAASAANAVVDTVRCLTTDARRRLVQRRGLFRRQLRHREGFDQLFPIRSNGKMGNRAGRAAQRIQPRENRRNGNELKEEKSLVAELIK